MKSVHLILFNVLFDIFYYLIVCFPFKCRVIFQGYTIMDYSVVISLPKYFDGKTSCSGSFQRPGPPSWTSTSSELVTSRDRRTEVEAGLTVVAVLVFAAADGAVRLHLQEETLFAEEPRHDALQLRLCNGNNVRIISTLISTSISTLISTLMQLRS